MEKAIAAKQKALKAWKTSKVTRASYDAAKCIARHAVHHACQEADKKVYENIDPKSSEVLCLANQFRRENADVVGDKPVKNDAGEISMIKDGLIRQLVSIDDSQFGFIPGRGTTDAIFVVRQLQEKYLAANKRLYMAFVDLEKAFD